MSSLSVLVVDDSAFMRLALRRIIEAEGDLRVVGEAADGVAAIEQVQRLTPDVVAMDIEMPGMDGLEATRRIMAARLPPAVVMVSHHTTEGSTMALAAMQAGAADWVCKDTDLGGLDFGHLNRELPARLRYWGRAQRAARPPLLPAAPVLEAQREAAHPEIVAIGASTGGPEALAALLAAAGALPVPVVVAQHMPARMAADLARALALRSGGEVVVAAPGTALRAGVTHVIPGEQDGALLRLPEGFALRLAPHAHAAHPSVDVLFASVAMAARGAVGVVLTGMGQDGTQGAVAMARRGFTLLAQAPESCVVPGMPGAVLAAVPGVEAAPPAALGERLRGLLG